MPNVKSKDGLDFANGFDLDSYNVNTNIYDSDLVDPTVPPSHYVEWVYDSEGNKKWGFSMGYIVDKSDTRNDRRMANSGTLWDLRDTKKSYPVAMGYITLEAGEYKHFMGFRNYLSPSETGDAVALNVVRDHKDTYVYADFSGSQVTGLSKLLDKDIGKNITLVQGENLTVLNDTVSSDGVVVSTSATTGNGVIKNEAKTYSE